MKTIFYVVGLFTIVACQSNENPVIIEPQEEIAANAPSAIIHPTAAALNDSAVSIMATQGRQAIALLDRAIEIQPNYFGAWHNKVNCQLHLGLKEDAIQSLLKMEEIDDSFPNTKTNLGILYDIKGDTAMATQKYQEVEAMYVAILDTVQPNNNPYQMYQLLRASNMKMMGKEAEANAYLQHILDEPGVDTIYTSKAVMDLLNQTRASMLEGFRSNIGGL